MAAQLGCLAQVPCRFAIQQDLAAGQAPGLHRLRGP
jgi:hypothetical protein